jgi:hypothetical protein
VVGNVLLGGFYLIVVAGLRLALAIMGKEVIRKRPNKSVATYWNEAEKVTDAQRYFRQF